MSLREVSGPKSQPYKLCPLTLDTQILCPAIIFPYSIYLHPKCWIQETLEQCGDKGQGPPHSQKSAYNF